MENKQEFLGEIQNHLSKASGVKTTPTGRRTKRMTKKMSYLLVFVVAISITASAALIISVLNFNMTGEMQLNGRQQPNITWDGTTEINSATPVDVDMDILSAMEPGDEFTVTHTLQAGSGGSFNVVFDTSSMPLEYVDVNDQFYGFTFKIYEHGTTTEITDIDVPFGDGPVEVDFYYALDPLFRDGGVPAFPFNVEMTANLV